MLSNADLSHLIPLEISCTKLISMFIGCSSGHSRVIAFLCTGPTPGWPRTLSKAAGWLATQTPFVASTSSSKSRRIVDCDVVRKKSASPRSGCPSQPPPTARVSSGRRRTGLHWINFLSLPQSSRFTYKVVENTFSTYLPTIAKITFLHYWLH